MKRPIPNPKSALVFTSKSINIAGMAWYSSWIFPCPQCIRIHILHIAQMSFSWLVVQLKKELQLRNLAPELHPNGRHLCAFPGGERSLTHQPWQNRPLLRCLPTKKSQAANSQPKPVNAGKQGHICASIVYHMILIHTNTMIYNGSQLDQTPN